MKLVGIQIVELFGIFDHKIKFKNQSGISIMIGENGIGKTVILEIIESFFNKKFQYFNSIKFKEITFEFDDEINFVLTKIIRDDDDQTLMVHATKNNEVFTDFLSFKLYPHTPYSTKNWNKLVNIYRAGYYNDQPSTWQEFKELWESGYFYENNVFKGNLFEPSLFPAEEQSFYISPPDWFLKRLEEIDIRLIRTQRLLKIEGQDTLSTVLQYSSELSQSIKKTLAESTELSSKLDRTYPERLIKRIGKQTKWPIKKLNQQLRELEEKRALLDKAGLIEIGNEKPFSSDSTREGFVNEVLQLYVEDSKQKLEIFDELLNKISFLINVINKRFKHKNLIIDKDKGFVFLSNFNLNGGKIDKTIACNKLSSGEQNELILFYELLFHGKKNSLFLIDEPEISLNISWQNCFVQDLREISKINNIEVLIATHSPDIISNNWNLTIELKGVE